MKKKSVTLEIDPTILEKNMRIVKVLINYFCKNIYFFINTIYNAYKT